MIYFRRLLILIFVVSFEVSDKPAQAHPHEWIDIKTALVFDERGRLEKIKMDWLLDEYSTAFTMEGMERDAEGSVSEASLNELAATIVGNLREFSYLTTFEPVGDVTIEKAVPMKGALDGIRFNFFFELILSEPLDLQGSKLTYSAYDPLYYIEILHSQDGPAVSLEHAPDGCVADLKKPNPDEAQVAYAQSLDRGEAAEDGLGAFFAERVEISCP